MIPGKMLKANYEFTFPKLEDALKEIFAVKG
jgi:NAD dependent epimerase/dehydratase family enzyme